MTTSTPPGKAARAWLRVALAVSGVVAFMAAMVTVLAYFWPTPAQQAEYTAPTPAPSTTALGPAALSPELEAYSGGWGPERDTFTTQSPAGYAVLNSITDNPVVGDERNFVRVRTAGTSDEFSDFVRADIGDTVEVSIAIFNDAADNLDGTAATIHGLQAEFWWPAAGADLPIGVAVSGKNASEVWDGATILTRAPAELKVLRDSAVMKTNAGEFTIAINGDYLSTMTLGWSAADGEYPVGYSSDGLYRGNGYLSLTVEIVSAE